MARGGRIITRIGPLDSVSIGAVAITGIIGMTDIKTGITMETITEAIDLRTMDIVHHQMATGPRTAETIHLVGAKLLMFHLPVDVEISFLGLCVYEPCRWYVVFLEHIV